MGDVAASASVSIAEPRTSSTTRLHYKIFAKDASGSPLAGEEITLRLEGDGSFAPGFSSKEVKRVTDNEGTAIVTWYRRSIFDRDVKATLTAECGRPGAVLSLESVHIVDTGPRTSYAGTRLR